MSIQHIYSIFLALIGALGICGASKMAMTRGPNLGPGAAPMAYSIILFALSVSFFLSARKEPTIIWKVLFTPPKRDGLIYFLMIVLLLGLMYLFGTAPAILVFSYLTLLYLNELPHFSIIIFSLCWVGALYVIFIKILGVPFERGLLF